MYWAHIWVRFIQWNTKALTDIGRHVNWLITQTVHGNTNTKTGRMPGPNNAIFSESRGQKDIKYHILSSQPVNFSLVNQTRTGTDLDRPPSNYKKGAKDHRLDAEAQRAPRLLVSKSICRVRDIFKNRFVLDFFLWNQFVPNRVNMPGQISFHKISLHLAFYHYGWFLANWGVHSYFGNKTWILK